MLTFHYALIKLTIIGNIRITPLVLGTINNSFVFVRHNGGKEGMGILHLAYLGIIQLAKVFSWWEVFKKIEARGSATTLHIFPDLMAAVVERGKKQNYFQ